MAESDSQNFLRELDKNGAERHRLPPRAARRGRAGARINLWTAADRLRSNLAVYGQDQWVRDAHLRRAHRARRVRLRWKQPNQSNPTTWRLAAMNMAIRGIDFNCGKEPANSFTQDQQPDLRADYVMVDSVNHTHFFELKICENLNFPIRYT